MKAILGVTGGIAAYKAAEVARSLMERGLTVQVVMTAGRAGVRTAAHVRRADRPEGDHRHVRHRERRGDALQFRGAHPRRAGCTGAGGGARHRRLIAKFARGLADDFLSTVYLAFTGPVVIAPAMNTNMWNHPATRENIAILQQRGHVIVEPAEGLLACGTYGPGRLAEPDDIVAQCHRALNPRDDLDGETVLITAGPTQEPLDPVRYVSNRSSGKMGYALAEAAAARGARVILVSGPVHLPAPRKVQLVRVTTAREMYQAVMEHLPEATIIIKSAAVADYHLANVPKQKVKKTATRLSLELEPTPDILAEAGRRKGDRLLVGFAAETENLLEEARRKLVSKNCDMVVANLVSQAGIGFESDENEVTLVVRTGETIPLERAGKRAIAEQILDQVLKLRLALHAAAMNRTEALRGLLEYYRDLGIKTLYRRAAAAKPPSSSCPNPSAVRSWNPHLWNCRLSNPPAIRCSRSSRTSATANAAACIRGATRSCSASATSSRRWCSSARARAPTRTRKGSRSSAARGSC